MIRWRVGKHRRTGYWLAFSENYDAFRPATLRDGYQDAARVFDTWRDACARRIAYGILAASAETERGVK
ncbi:hypothetical protein BHG00_09860 [Corynebacterium ulcerans]|uniref:hypothetical protein n=1 Tax=Corynebacterium ulcerans TaxID=65058 RepID=UPI0008FB861C|nr:hypothetical protein [Corynebacterium ulcerans]MBH5301430.1 hypothetical protein [Corynebacterium ulcerans]OIS05326.1 hypothetical protein BHG00_09860 [Corynebacterium ulcerans]